VTTEGELREDNEELRRRLEEAEDAIRALHAGEVDAIVVAAERETVYTLEAADRTYRLLVEQMPQAAATLRVTGEILSCNRPFADMLGRPVAVLVHQPFQEFVAPEHHAGLEALLQQSLAAEVETELRLQCDDGERPAVCLRIAALREGALGQCLMITDQTEQRHYRELREAQESLRAAVADLERSNAEKDEFLATLAHELRNPLAPIRSAVEIIRLGGPVDPELSWAREVIERQVHVMARLLEDLLDVSRLSRQRLELRCERLVLSAVVDAALETTRPLIEARQHTLAVDLPPEPIHLEGDPVRLAQVFSNLLNNAAKYTEKGGEIRFSAALRGDEAVVSVRDNGIGIPAEALPHIFEIFSQATPLSMQSRSGLGIGLSLVKGLVELHGGHVEVHCEGAELGSEFVVRLPLAQARAAGSAPGGDSEQPVGQDARRVLVVDDNRDSADSLSRILELAGHTVHTAYDGERALQVAAEMRPEVVLLDLGMPRVDGYQACRRIRGEPWGRDVLMIAVTGWGQEADRRRSAEAGFDVHLVKPVPPARLRRVVTTRSPKG
jgi:PAS domain S-box-containing protein